MKRYTKKSLFHNSCFSLNKALISGGVYLAVFLSTILSHSSVIAASQTYYVTFNGSGSKNGSNYLDSWSWSDFLSSGNWSATENTAKIDPGDTVYLSGTFNIGKGTKTIPGGGSGGNYVVIDGDDGVNPSATINPTDSGVTSIYVSGKDYLEFRDITFGGSSTILILTRNGDYIKIHDCTMIGDYFVGIYVQAGSDYIYIYNNTITSTRVGTNADGIKLTPNAASPPSSNLYVYNNTVSDWNHTGIEVLSYTNNAAVSYVYIYENYINLPNRGYGRAFSTNSVTDGNVHHVYIHHNYIDSMRAPTQISNANDIYVYNNIFYNAMNCCESADDAGCNEAYSNCTSKQYYGTGSHLALGTFSGGIERAYIYNNVFYKSAEASLRFSLNVDGDIDNVDIRNNIFYDGANAATPDDDPSGSVYAGRDYTIYGEYDAVYALKNITFTNNIVYSPTGQKTIKWRGKTYLLSEFESAFSWASDNIPLDPLFTDPDNKDFTLLTNSPAINAGTTLDSNYAFSWDPNTSLPPNSVETLNQNEFGSGWDLGAYVFYALSKPNPPPNSPANFGIKKEVALK